MQPALLDSSQRVLIQNVPWETYESLLEARGNDPAPRLTFDRGSLEISSPSAKHEWLKKLVGRLIEAYTEERGIDVKSVSAMTLKNQLKAKGLEPEESYYVQNEALVRAKEGLDLAVDPPPDLVVEIDVSSSSIDKLGAYASLGVREVWAYDAALVMHRLRADGTREVIAQSKALPGLTTNDLNRVLAGRGKSSETKLVLGFRDSIRERHLSD